MANDNVLKWPSEVDEQRLNGYTYNDKLYFGQHFEAFALKTPEDMSKNYAILRYIVTPFPSLASRTLADMLFGEDITIDFDDDTTQEFVDAVMEKNHFITQLYESELVNSRRGDAVFKIRIGKRNPSDTTAEDELIIEEIPAYNYFPEFDNVSARNVPSREIIAVKFTVGNTTYLHKEIYTPGNIDHEVWEYKPDTNELVGQLAPESLAQFNIPVHEETGIKRNPVFHIPNVRDGSGYFGTSDYNEITPLLFAINNRLTKIDNVLDKHSDPVLAVPPGVIDDEGRVKKEALGVFQVDTDNPGFNKPEYIVWDANMEASFNEVDKLLTMLHVFTEIAEAATGTDKNGTVESGRALKFKLLSTIRKRNRKIAYYDAAIKDILYTVIELAQERGIAVDGLKPGKLEKPSIHWGDGVINDEVEMVDISIKRIDAGLSSKADEIARLDGIPVDDAKDKVKEIEAENAPDVTALVPQGQGQMTGQQDQNMNQNMQNGQQPPTQQ